VLGAPDAWDSPEKARSLSATLHGYKNQLTEVQRINGKLDDVKTLIELYQEDPQPATMEEVRVEIKNLGEMVAKSQMKLFLSGKYDDPRRAGWYGVVRLGGDALPHVPAVGREREF
jgi:peptide chain release factor 2